MKTKALFSVLSRKFKDGEVIFLDDIVLKAPKTKEAKNILTALSINKKKNAAFIALWTKDENIKKSFSNFGNIETGQLKDLNILDLLQYKYLLITEPEKSFKTLEARIK